jgi:SAM-dependent methyltransferase
MSQIDRAFGRRAFGADAPNYDRARPPYPAWVFDQLRETCGVGAGAAVLEIGAGTGAATRRLLGLEPGRLVAVEPDARLAEFLRQATPSAALELRLEAFEDVDLSENAFDLAAAFTSFHWLDESAALAKISRLLRRGGWWAACWNVFGDDAYPDPFHEATRSVLSGPLSPSAGTGGVPFALDAAARIAAIASSGAFARPLYWTAHWPLELTTDETVALYATYSNVEALPDRQAVLAELRRIADETFGGRVIRNMTTVLYLAQRT